MSLKRVRLYTNISFFGTFINKKFNNFKYFELQNPILHITQENYDSLTFISDLQQRTVIWKNYNIISIYMTNGT